MADLTAGKRAGMPQSEFALPGKRFPMNDAEHDRLAIIGASRSEHAGNISASTADRIKAEARAKLGESHPRTHALTMASADHLHRHGYIGAQQHQQIRGAAQAKMDAHKQQGTPRTFGSLG